MANWTAEQQPYGANRAPLLTGLAEDKSGPIPVAVDPATGRLLVNSVGGTTASSVAINDGVSTSTKATVATLTNANPLAVEIVDGTGTQITSFGGGTQYTDGNTPPTHPVGTMPIYNNGSTWSQVSLTNPLPVQVGLEDLVDTGNSTTTALGANGTFTGTGHSTLGYSYIKLYVYADQSSATNGVQIQFSSDNTNWNDASLWTFTSGGTAPNNGQTYGAATRGQYYRIVYTNGATAQTTFRLQTVIKDHAAPGDMVTMTAVPNSTNHAMLTKASIVGLTTAGGGAFVDVKVNPSGALTTASTTLDAAGNSITSNSTTTTGTYGLDMNIRSILNTAPTTPGYLDIKGADGNVFVRQATAANLNATVVGTGTFAVQAAQSGTWSVTANAGTNLNTSALALESGGNLATIATNTAGLDSTVGTAGSAVPTKGLLVQGSDGTDARTLHTDTSGNLDVNVQGTVPVSGTSANLYTGQTTVNTTQVQLDSTSHSLDNGIIVKALTSNSAAIYVGLTGVTTSTGDILEAGDTRGYAINNTNLLYIISAASTSDKVSWSAN